MVRKFINILGNKTSDFASAVYLLAFFSLLSQFIGILRDRLLAGVFGPGLILDTYYASFRIPDLIFIFVASLISASVIIPFLSSRLEDKDSASVFINSVFSVFSIILVFISILAFFLTPILLKIFFPILFTGNEDTLVLITRIMLIQPILLGLSNVWGSIAQTDGRFFAYAVAPVFYNLGIVVGVLVLFPIFGLVGLSFGVILGALMHALLQLPAIIRIGIIPRFRLHIWTADVKRLFRLSVPRSLAISFSSLSFFFMTALASRIGEGGISIFNLSFAIQSVPLSIIGASYSMAAFPTLSSLFSKNNRDQFSELLNSALRFIIFWSVPIMILFIILRAQIVRTVFGFGAFNWADTRLTAALMAVFIISILAQNIVILFSRTYYAMGITKIPFWTNFFTSIFGISFSYTMFKFTGFFGGIISFFTKILKIDDVSANGLIILPFAFSLASFLNAFLLIVIFISYRGMRLDIKGLIEIFWKVLISAMSAGFITFLSLNIFDNVFNLNTVFGIFMQGFLSGIFGIFSFGFLMRLFKSEELKSVLNIAFKKIRQTKIVEDSNITPVS